MVAMRAHTAIHDGEDEDTTPFERANIFSYLGADRPFEGNILIEDNTVRDRNLGCGMAQWAPRKEGYCIAVIHREAFLYDGSTINTSILASVGTPGQTHHQFRGPMVALRRTPFETYEDITLADFRHIIDYFVSYAITKVRESDQDRGFLSLATIRGAKICCYGEIKLHGSEPHISVDITRGHPTRRYGAGDVSSISERLVMPLKLWKDPNIGTWRHPPGWHEIIGATSNQDAAFLMTRTDFENWGWAPPEWQVDLGNVIAVRVDDKNLTLDDFRAMCYFVRRKLQPMFEDALGLGSVLRTRKSVLDFITWENMQKYNAKMAEDVGSGGQSGGDEKLDDAGFESDEFFFDAETGFV
ncbi:hypothetical protein B0J13DRAFT_641104 [Dactylonectria estremocensis]|uniref:Uncharacterized protein n=1 Tax=Dactylonectria estremocensis TaxID=1079267 RepID=A0A9P9ECD1_9HYPO|nr:hypothetical protein B0J13DRAFT_641104 [Dactylonectria estremocensis]